MQNMNQQFAELIVPRHREFFVHSTEFGLAGVACMVIACTIAAVVLGKRKRGAKVVLPRMFWLFLGSGVCLIALNVVLASLEGPIEI